MQIHNKKILWKNGESLSNIPMCDNQTLISHGSLSKILMIISWRRNYWQRGTSNNIMSVAKAFVTLIKNGNLTLGWRNQNNEFLITFELFWTLPLLHQPTPKGYIPPQKSLPSPSWDPTNTYQGKSITNQVELSDKFNETNINLSYYIWQSKYFWQYEHC